MNVPSLSGKHRVSSEKVPQAPIGLGHLKDPADFSRVSSEMERLNVMREQLADEAFVAMEGRYTLLAQMLLQHIGNRSKAARWMCSHQKVFGGRTGYDAIADGDMELIWDVIAGKD